MFQNIGTTEIIIIFLVVIIFFGGKKIPELARGVGEALREFKNAAKENDEKPRKKKK